MLQVVNWKRHQHYKAKDESKPQKAPWIKLYRDLLGDYAFQCLSEKDRFALVGFFLLAAETDNKIPDDLPWIRRKLAINRTPPVSELIDAGFLEKV